MRLRSHLRLVMGLIFSIDSIATGMGAVDGEGISFNRKWLKCSTALLRLREMIWIGSDERCNSI